MCRHSDAVPAKVGLHLSDGDAAILRDQQKSSTIESLNASQRHFAFHVRAIRGAELVGNLSSCSAALVRRYFFTTPPPRRNNVSSGIVAHAEMKKNGALLHTTSMSTPDGGRSSMGTARVSGADIQHRTDSSAKHRHDNMCPRKSL